MNDFSKPPGPQRDELAREIFIADNSGQSREASLKDWEAYAPGEYAYTYAIADGFIAAGWTKPRTITAVEELDALPVGQKVVSGGYEWTKNYSTTYMPGHAVEREQWFNVNEDSYDSHELDLPAILLSETAP